MKNEGKPDRRGMFSALRILGMPVFLGCPGGFIGYSLLSILHSMVLTFETISQQQVFGIGSGHSLFPGCGDVCACIGGSLRGKPDIRGNSQYCSGYVS